jgi:hypothetical protein
MARTTKQLSGGGKDKFLRALVASEVDIPAEAAARLGDTLCTSIADVRVRRDTWDAVREMPAAAVFPASAAEPTPVRTEPKAKPAAKTAKAPVEAIPEPVAAPAFDPFVFSALAVLAKKGAAALSARLVEVTSAGDLHALASAQHLPVDASVSDVTALRAAILAATEARLAERRAAAS